jgi:hypothetical protein
VNVRRPKTGLSGTLEGYRGRAATTATAISLFTLKSDPMAVHTVWRYARGVSVLARSVATGC